MATYISLLRGINVGQKMMKMAELKKVFEALELKHVQTYVQSGNVLFESTAGNAEQLSGQLEKGIEQAFGFTAEVLLRQVNELEHVLRHNPFLEKPGVDAAKLHVTFLAELPLEPKLAKLEGFQSGPDEFQIVGKEVYLHCPEGYGRTKLSNSFFEKKLGVTATTRNWRTVNMLVELAGGMRQ